MSMAGGNRLSHDPVDVSRDVITTSLGGYLDYS